MAEASSPQLSVTTPLGADKLLLQHVSYEDALGRMFEMHLDLLSPDPDLDFDALLGEKVTVEIAVPGQDPGPSTAT